MGELSMPKKKTGTIAAEAAAATQAPIVAWKGFDEDFACRGFAYAVGETYRHEGRVEACVRGFHACEHPLDVFRYYPPAGSRFAMVELGGETAREADGDSKIAAAEITIKAEIRLPELIQAAIRYVMDRAKWIEGTFASGPGEGVRSDEAGGAATASGDWGAATASGERGAATASGRWGAATASGERGAATASGARGAATASGDWGAATASGRWGAATASGERGAATASGDWGAATASGRWGAATASGYQGAATASGRWGAAIASGERGAATASGYQGAATASGARGAATASGRWGAATASGERGAATASGYQGAATASGYGGKARGAAGNALFLVERRDDGEIVNVWAGIVGRDGIEPMVWYRLVDGTPQAVAED
jgi:hypothetical protein